MANNRLHRDSGQRAALTGADLRDAKLSDANLHEANLREADLGVADMGVADLSRANLTEACYDISTTWPEGFDPKAKGAVLVED